MSRFLHFAARSDVGLRRENNQDSGYAGPRLLAVADGVGGQVAGNIASSTVIAALASLDDDIPAAAMLDTLAGTVEQANETLREMIAEQPHLEGMGTTLTALLWTGSRMGLVHVGDSRAYLLRDGELAQLTQDHTWVQRLVDEGQIKAEEADDHPQRSLIMRAIDGRDSVELDLSVRQIRLGDRYLVCSDGLSSIISHDTITATLRQGTVEQAVTALVKLALRAGGPDNVTCIAADVVDSDTDPAPGPLTVGAAAENSGTFRDPSLATPAGRAAAALGKTPPDPEVEQDHSLAVPALTSRRSAVRKLLAPTTLLVLLAGSVVGFVFWSRQQYYVGAAGDQVAVYRGLNQNVGGLELSSLHQRVDIELEQLPGVDRARVSQTITADNLGDAHRIVERLRVAAATCAAERVSAISQPPPASSAGCASEAP